MPDRRILRTHGSLPPDERSSLDCVHRSFTAPAPEQMHFAAISALGNPARAQTREIASFPDVGYHDILNFPLFTMSDMDLIQKNKGFPMQRAFQLLAAMILLVPAISRATPILDFSAGFAGSIIELELQWLGPNFRHKSAESPMEDSFRSAPFGRETRSIFASSVVNLRFKLPRRLRPDSLSLFNAPVTLSPRYPYEYLGFTPMSPSLAVKFDIWAEAQILRQHDGYLLEWRISRR